MGKFSRIFFLLRIFVDVPVFISLLAVSFLFSACKSKPASQEEPRLSFPSASLVFNGIEADDPVHLKLLFALDITYPLPAAGQVKIESWQVNLNGKNASPAFTLDFPESTVIASNSSIPLRLNMDIAALAEKGLAPHDDYSVTLITELVFNSDFTVPMKFTVSGLAEFPGVLEPKFKITSIAILQAELINTRFRVGLRIDNPNPYPVELSAFSYKLFGNGRLWAEGEEKNIIQIPENFSVEGNLFMMMNFIDMERRLLDQIINLVDVNYRFSGEAQVSTGVDYLPVFNTEFNLSGYSEVLEK